MPLTDDERRRLDEIAGALRRSDARLETAPSTGRLRKRRLHLTGTCFVLASFGCLATALALAEQVLCLAAWLLYMTGMLFRSLAD